MAVADGLLTENVLHCLGNTASLPGLLSAVDLIMMIEIDKFDHAAILFDGKDQNKGLFDMNPVESFKVMSQRFIMVGIVQDLTNLFHQSDMQLPILPAYLLHFSFELFADRWPI
jgi:hypothetical protein